MRLLVPPRLHDSLDGLFCLHQNNLSRRARHGSLAIPSVPGFYILNLVENDVEYGEGAADVLLQAGTAS